MRLKVAQLYEIAGMPDYGEMLRQAELDVEFLKKPSFTEEEIIANARDADAIIGIGTHQPFSKKVMDNLPKCRFIMSVGIGYDQIDVSAATVNCILVANVPDYCWEEVSDHIMALILSCSRRVVQLNTEVKKGGWRSEPVSHIQTKIWPGMSKLKEQTLGLIGFGAISRALSGKARAFGLKMLAYDPYISSEIFSEYGVERVSELNQILTKSDIVAINVNLTPENRHMIGMPQFKMMRSNACIINTARGPLIDGKALYVALKEGYISIAAVDVTEPEPISLDDPLLKLDNFIVTAHSAHYSPPAYQELVYRPGQEIIRLFKKGEWPKGLLNPEIKQDYIKKWGELE